MRYRSIIGSNDPGNDADPDVPVLRRLLKELQDLVAADKVTPLEASAALGRAADAMATRPERRKS